MAKWSDRVRQAFLPWGSSVLLHAVILLLLPWLVVLSIPPQAQQAVEVELVGLLPGGGGGSARGGKDQQLSQGTDKRLGPPLRKAAVESPRVAPPQVPVAAKPTPPPAVPKEEEDREPKPVETVVTEQQTEPVTVEPSVVPSIRAPSVDEAKQPTTSGGNSRTDGSAATAEIGANEFSDATEGGTAGFGTRFSAVPGAGGGVGGGIGGGGIDWRQLMRRRIENAKRYPAMARRLGMEGTVHLEFRIARDGGIEAVNVVKSSGYPLLDEASVQAIKRAAPLPIVPGKIRVPISYRLHKGP